MTDWIVSYVLRLPFSDLSHDKKQLCFILYIVCYYDYYYYYELLKFT
jgi:hypothetical protein